jgi:hypothetical protein
MSSIWSLKLASLIVGTNNLAKCKDDTLKSQASLSSWKSKLLQIPTPLKGVWSLDLRWCGGLKNWCMGLSIHASGCKELHSKNLCETRTLNPTQKCLSSSTSTECRFCVVQYLLPSPGSQMSH